MPPFPKAALLAAALFAAPCAAEEAEKPYTTEVQFDPYYTSAGVDISLTGAPIPHLDKTSEAEIYGRLIRDFYKPRNMVLEASFNALPYAGTVIRRSWPGLYSDATLSGSFNLVEAATAGFEEPWALSLFFGNVLKFDSVKGSFTKRTAYSGLLIDVGDYHIKSNTLIYDKWLQAEFKLKGDQEFEDRKLRWSFRAGAKFHDNPGIEDSVFVGVRRSRTDFKERGGFLLNNSGVEYVSDFSRRTLSPLRHFFLVDKKFPSKGARLAYSLGLGFVWNSGKKYSGRLEDKAASSGDFQFIIRPNIEF